jgi:hypothetical protein
MVQTIQGFASDWRRLDERIEYLSVEIESLARQDGAESGAGDHSGSTRITKKFGPLTHHGRRAYYIGFPLYLPLTELALVARRQTHVDLHQ